MCSVCGHKKRVAIETAMLSGQPLAIIAEDYNIDVNELRNHQRKCSSYTMSLDEFDLAVARELENIAANHSTPEHVVEAEKALHMLQSQQKEKRGAPTESIQRQVALREVDLLAESAREFMRTLKNLGNKINDVIEMYGVDDTGLYAKNMLSKAVVDLYVLAGAEVRQTVKTMADIQKQKADTGLLGDAGVPQVIIMGRDGK